MHLDQITDRLPQPAFYPSQKERALYTKELLTEGLMYVHLEGKFNNSATRNSLAQALAVNVWLLPSAELGNQLPLQASSVHGARPATLVYDTDVPGILEGFDIVAKPVDETNRAFRETRNLREALLRDIPTVEPVAVVETPDAARKGLVITALKKGVVPLATINLAGINSDNSDFILGDLMENLGGFLADNQAKGFFHNDLHPGNIGLDTKNGKSNDFILFDLERAELMNYDKMRRILNPFCNKRIPKPPVYTEIKFLNDAANLLAGMVVYNPNVNAEFVKQAFLKGYYGSSPLYSRDSSHFEELFEAIYPQKVIKQSAVQDRIRKRRHQMIV